MTVKATATIAPSGTWMVNVEGVEVIAQVNRLSEAVKRAAELALGATGNPYAPEDVDALQVELSVVLEPDDQAVVEAATEARERALECQQQATEAQRAAVTRLTGIGLTLTDAGYVLGLSRQRASQLVHSENPDERR